MKAPYQVHLPDRDRRGRMPVLAVLTFAALGTVVRANDECLVWSARAVFTREDHAMAYDSARGVTVLFGGYFNPGARLNDTWESNGVVWQPVAYSGPSPSTRQGAAMAYDAGRRKTVLFGGTTERQEHADTWEWDGRTWTQRDVEAPHMRPPYELAYDAVARRLLLVGQSQDNRTNWVTWSWDGESWQPVTEVGPPRWGGFSLTPSGVRKSILFYAFRSGLWEWQGDSWVQLAADGPNTGNNPGLAYDERRRVLVNVGSPSNQGAVETWEWKGEEWALRNVEESPPGRQYTAMVYDAAHGVCMLFGGNVREAWEERPWLWDGEQWRSMINGRPAVMTEHAMAYDSVRGRTVVVGQNRFIASQATWEWAGAGWLVPEHSDPPALRDHAMAFDRRRGVTVLYGGSGSLVNNYVGTWEWDGRVWTRVEDLPQDPGPRNNPAMAYDSWREEIVLFGSPSGFGPTAHIDETWLYDGSSWRQVVGEALVGRRAPEMAFDSRRGVMVMFGGNENGPLGDTWEWDGEVWTLRATTGPPPRYWHAMAYDSKRGVTLVYGGTGSSRDMDDLWAWDGETWKALGRAPVPAYHHAMAYDEARDALQYFGGEGYHFDTDRLPWWERRVDTDCDGYVDGDDPCEGIGEVRTTCRNGRGRGVIKASAVVHQPAGTPVTFALDDDDLRMILVEAPGRRLRAKWRNVDAGPHDVCILQCRSLRRCSATDCE
ncbi:MAG: hypothetical protein KJ057_16565 [Phycisphaerae bacterium]|nr:MAG: hypothetical protein F9K17_10055 [Phycisphaerae bacterium]MBE7458883.1 hypothetical protein [Planctomycetia bacterium]MCK6466139.1 kelch repeat-containing protein [Phycisphaerae bacterium]MCL4720082.1 hypothetical protein [Phycisphaerae bacterium]NUQ09827.1 hypothetical protein [Phycisphaerae bacterium]